MGVLFHTGVSRHDGGKFRDPLKPLNTIVLGCTGDLRGNASLSGQLLVRSALFFYYYYTQRNLFEILLNQTEIRLYLPFFDWFGTKRTSVWFHINQKMVNTICFRFDLMRFLCEYTCSHWLTLQAGHIALFLLRENLQENCAIYPNLDCVYTFSLYLAPLEI